MTSARPIELICKLEDIASEHLKFGSWYEFHLPVTSPAYNSTQDERENGLTISIIAIL